MLFLLAGVKLVRAAEAERLAIPAERLLEFLRHHDEMAEPLDVRRAALDPEELALAAVFVLAGIDLRPLDRDRSQHLHAVDDLDLVAVGVGQAHPLAAARLVDILDLRGALDPGHPLEVFHAGGVDRDADIARLAQFGHMEVMRRIGAAHVERVLGAVGADHAEIGQERFLACRGRASAAAHRRGRRL